MGPYLRRENTLPRSTRRGFAYPSSRGACRCGSSISLPITIRPRSKKTVHLTGIQAGRACRMLADLFADLRGKGRKNAEKLTLEPRILLIPLILDRAGSQEVTGSIPVSSTNRINHLHRPPKSKNPKGSTKVAS